MNRIESCPICGSNNIDTVVQTGSRDKDKLKRFRSWAFCRECKHRSMISSGIFESEEEARRTAIRLWNEACRSKLG